MPDSTLAGLTAATAATGGLYYGTQGGADRKFTISAAGAAIAEAADAAAQRTAMGAAGTAANTLTGAQTISVNGAASTPPLVLTGTIFTGGSATTTKPALLVEPAGTTSTGWSTSGTMIGANAPSGFTGRLLDLQVNGDDKVWITSTGTLVVSGQIFASGSIAANGVDCGSNNLFLSAANDVRWNNDTFLFRGGAAGVIQMGANHATTAINQTFKAHNVTNGTAAKLTIAGGNATTGTGGAVEIKGGTGTVANGLVLIKDIPTSNPGSGYLWNNAGTLEIGT
jgi:hypothetical protein